MVGPEPGAGDPRRRRADRGRRVGDPEPARGRLPGPDQRAGAGAGGSAGAVSPGGGAARRLPGRSLVEWSSARGGDPLDEQVCLCRDHGGVRGGCGRVLRPDPGRGAIAGGAGVAPARCRGRAGTTRRGGERDLPLHPGGRRAQRDGASHPARSAGQAAAPLGPRWDRNQRVRGLRPADAGHRLSRETHQLRRLARRRSGGGRGEQPHPRGRLPGKGRRAVHPSRHRASKHPRRPGAHRHPLQYRWSARTAGQCGRGGVRPRGPAGGGDPRRPGRGDERDRDDAARREQSRSGSPRSGKSRADQ